MTFKVIETGSSGNCFLFGELMIDCGLPYSKIKDHVKPNVLLTHCHGDHFNNSTIRKLSTNHDVTFYALPYLCERLQTIGIDNFVPIEVGKVYQIGEYKVSPVMAYHDVENVGYRIMYKSIKHFHITDTVTLEGITARNYTSASIECNHCEIAALQLIETARQNGEFTHMTRAMNTHLSVQKAIEFILENDIKNMTPIHIGISTKDQVMYALNQIRNKVNIEEEALKNEIH
ncbi:MBL fold metallo-hydrolase [Wohlfahrtiimonas sp. G9077]|uniref:MBL fold metallo-hydrolase n=1 Tax=Wohlfahrtiimonas sp. G9077 TaxID=1980118 RepID=UPI000B99B03C|nr:MBL fold metallo-hydrolase [Wohlfahrtiimonas sp. G9077]OYQ75528.1 hypothetical protein B9T20_02170 [Wohlfahrtiimonas sp. G9077]